MPRGELVAVPRPRIETASLTTAGAKVAVVCLCASIVTLQSAAPEQAPSQCRKREPGAAVARRTTAAPCSQPIEHVPGQAMPGRSLATEPCPLPANETASSSSGEPTCESQGESWTSNQAPE